jgi:hypothetical protein
MLSLVVLLLLHACGDPTVPRIGPPPPVLIGEWSTVRPAPIVQIHLQLLPTGKVLSWGRKDDPQVWDPATGVFTAVPAPSLLFCAGHDFLPDGRLLVTGGHISDLHGLPNANVFDPVGGAWQVQPAMAAGRWYPTNTTLPDGEVLTLAGTDSAGAQVTIPEVWTGTGWRQLTGASLALLYYPRVFRTVKRSAPHDHRRDTRRRGIQPVAGRHHPGRSRHHEGYVHPVRFGHACLRSKPKAHPPHLHPGDRSAVDCAPCEPGVRPTRPIHALPREWEGCAFRRADHAAPMSA